MSDVPARIKTYLAGFGYGPPCCKLTESGKHQRDCPRIDSDRYREALEAERAKTASLRKILVCALDEYVDHQSWRCAHPDRYPLDEVDPPDCPCGLEQFQLQARAALSASEGEPDAD